jgi:hypothetical protein
MKRFPERRAAALLPLVWALVLLPEPVTPPAHAQEPAPSPRFAGLVRDSVGNLLADVEVLVIERAASLEPVGSARSGSDGRFAIPELTPGAYRVAALKDGYLTTIQAVNTRLSAWVELVLQPAAAGEARRGEPAPDDPAWVLRVPRRYILRDAEPEVVARTAPANASNSSNASGDLHMEVAQLFDVAANGDGAAAGEPHRQGSETRVQVASAIGRHGSIRFDGTRDSLDTSQSTDAIESTASRSSDALGLAMTFATGADGRLDVAAAYDRRDLDWSAQALEASETRRHAQRALGYDTRWSRGLESDALLAVELSYRDLRSDLDVGAVEDLQSSRASASNRALRAAGSYERDLTDRHRVRLRASADLLETPMAGPGAVSEATFREPVRGAAMGLEADDLWKLSAPFSLTYGLAYRHAVDGRDTAVLVPRVGGIWQLDRVVWSFAVSYYDAAGDVAGTTPGLGDFLPAERVGYETQLEVPIGDRLRVEAGTSYAPLQLGVIGDSRMAYRRGASPIFLTDGNAAVRNDRIALAHETKGTRSWVAWNGGRATGNLAGLHFYDTPHQNLAHREVDYDNGQIGVHVEPSGTDVVLQYVTVDERGGTDLADGFSAEQRAVELQVMQDVARLQTLGHWRFLVGARVESVELEDRGGDLQSRALDTMGRRLSAGLSVAF